MLKERQAQMAGTWYPGDPDQLQEQISSMLEQSRISYDAGPPRALAVPHAGYMYSGQVAACGFKTLGEEQYDTIVVIAPSHREAFPGVSLFEGDAYHTPLGRLGVDKELLRTIAAHDNGTTLRLSTKGHREEHSLELQLPFLQLLQHDFKLVPLVMGEQDYETAEELAKILHQVCADRKCLVVASTDLSHFHSLKKAKELDGRFIELFSANKPRELAGELSTGCVEACGGGPVLAAMLFNQLGGGTSYQVVKYDTSARVTRDEENVVGYFAGVMT
ncbi:MAG: AmmeMemoRadiSam system protein B [Candidatus Delongbacteria bacterium]|nr:AmmeMemoRadiSam system protein B [bacterium]MBL7032811.1 AmmeMemoRadiSam system protein B [Candidatus Delongbacteria bacterium]